ncbi:hypothetical protein K2173_009896 [Erythroxylum novogranatense]|uniref:Uncharacterized protein n=1 Tax=Erythroxylum novogranatense TaxID=1862640 RepID=A0AAV8T0L8_9ROSI|nr:hypothetical protein K2173_009896 [Erythroxylum novogranatense]
MASQVEIMLQPTVKKQFPISSFDRPPHPSSPIFPSVKPTFGTSKSVSSAGSVTMPKPGGVAVSHSTSMRSRMPTVTEIEERKKKGLCYWCRAKYSFGHKCTRSQLYQLLIEGEDAEEDFEDCQDNPELLLADATLEEMPTLSLHAMLGSAGYDTMRIQAMIGNKSVVILVDSGSAHNFVDAALVKALGLSVWQHKQLQVAVADGGEIDHHRHLQESELEPPRFQIPD